ncbi:hypothetical protein TNCV_1305091 [Trichonephila clavipes]|nr:hypothetical protein TNCV_1305091 [Trichonephila clavipes]
MHSANPLEEFISQNLVSDNNVITLVRHESRLEARMGKSTGSTEVESTWLSTRYGFASLSPEAIEDPSYRRADVCLICRGSRVGVVGRLRELDGIVRSVASSHHVA